MDHIIQTHPYQKSHLSKYNGHSNSLNPFNFFKHITMTLEKQPTLLKFLIFSAIIVLAFPACIFFFFFVPFLLFISLPLLFSYLIYKVVAIPVEFVRRSMFGPSFDKKGKTNTNEFGLRARDRQESIDFDNWEFPSSCATEEDVNERNQLEELVHDHQHNDHEQHNDQEESWQIVFSKSSNYNPSNKELKQFDEVLRYWKTKERGQM